MESMDIEVKRIGEQLELIRIGLINYFVSNSLLFDCGTTCTAERLVERVNSKVDPRLASISHIVVSHAHFDHIAGLAVLKARFPAARVLAHPRIGQLVKKEKVIEAWNNENKEFCEKFGEETLKFDLNFEIEEVGEGTLVSDMKVIETPGHSADAISLLNEEGIMLVADALGYPLSSKNVPMFFHSFSKYVESIEKIRGLAEKVCLGHNGAIFSVDYCDVALDEAYKLREEIKEGLTEDELFKRIYKEELSLYPVSTIKGVAKLLVKRSLEGD
ncbi:MAG: MBL fold metallo-hydrolase [Archaeoglobus sp.]|nr:MBL fold metallo-hydrolase [Archaeoglobus sp.]